jgi:hypothetical protein
VIDLVARLTERMPAMSFSVRVLMCLSVALGVALVPAMRAAPVSAQSCTDLIVDGGFETGGGWVLGPAPVPPQYVTFTRHSGNRSLMLGITSGANVESFSSARQTVTIPASALQATLSFWFYAMAGAPATTDYMEVVLLDPAGAILTKPWVSHNNSQLWNQMSFDLTPWRGQTVQVYFNVYNDGLGGTAAMFLDDVALTTCAGGVTIVPTGGVTIVPSGTPTPTPSGTPGPVCVDAIVNGDFSGGLTSWQVVSGAPTLVSSPVHSAPYALQLGSLTSTTNELTSVRQLVTIPTGYSQATLGVWIYTQAQAGTDADFQEIAIWNSSGTLKLATLWWGRQNNPAWSQLLFNVAGFAGQSVFVTFSVNNDGVGGRTSMTVDDVRLQSCNATPGPAPTPTRTATPWIPTPPITAVPPIITLTPFPPGCIDLLLNGGFEAGWPPWIVPYNPIMPQIVTAPVFNGYYAAQFGSQTQNASSYSSARQWVTIPWSHPRVVLQFWAYTWAQSLSGADRQMVVLLAPGDTVMSVPWKVLQNQQSWQPHSFELIGLAGQTFAVYFNVINDGAGGRTAMFVDDAHLWACSTGANPPAMPVAVPLPAPAAAVPPVVVVPLDAAGVTSVPAAAVVAAATAAVSPPAALTEVVPSAALAAAAVAGANITRVAVAQPTQVFAGTAVAPPTESGNGSSRFPNLLSDIDPRQVLRWFLVVTGVIVLFLVLLWMLRKIFKRTPPQPPQ